MWKRIMATLSAIALIVLGGAATSVANADEGGPFQFEVIYPIQADTMQSRTITLTTPDGTVKTVDNAKVGQSVDLTKYPAGTKLNAEIVMRPTNIIYSMPGDINLDMFEVSSEGSGNDGFVTYRIKDLPLSSSNASDGQRILFPGAQVGPFNSVSYNLNGGRWPDGFTFVKGSRLRDNQQYITPLKTVVRPADPVKDGYTFLGWSGTSALLDEYNEYADSGQRAQFTVNDPYRFDEVDPNITDAQIRGTVVNLKAEWGRLSLSKNAKGSSYRKAGEKITYVLTAYNSSSAKLTELKFNDPRIDTSNCPTEIEPNKSVTCEIEYAVTQEEIDSGYAKNTATASAKVNDQVTLTSQEASHNYYLIDLPRLSLVKSVTPVADGAKPGQRVDYSFEVANNGNVTLDQIKIDDPKITDVTCNPTKLAPGESVKCTAKYTLTQADVDAGEVKNTAKATAKGPINTRYPNGKDVTSADSSATLTIVAAPELTLTKEGKAAESVKAGDKVDYTFTVVNTGNVTVKGVTVTDPKIANVTCAATELAADASMTCTGEYILTQADIDTGKVDNTATASGKDPKGADVQSTEATATVELKQEPKLTLTKAANPTSGVNEGDKLAYSFTVTNEGNVQITQVSVNDPKIVDVTCAAAELAPAAQTTCAGEYTVTAGDIAEDKITNTAHAIGNDPANQPVQSNDATAEVITAFKLPSAEQTADKVGQDVQVTPEYPANIDKASIRLLDPQGNEVEGFDVPKQGTWSVDENGQFTFTPLPGFLGTPEPVQYIALNTVGTKASEPGTTKVSYPQLTPVPSTSTGVQGVAQSSDPLTEMFPGVPENADPKYSLAGADSNGQLIRPGEGTYEIKDGKIVFTPEVDYVGTPAPVEVTMTTANGDQLQTTYSPTVTDANVSELPDGSDTKNVGETLSVTPKLGADIDTKSIAIVDADPDSNGKSKTLDKQGTWTVDENGEFTFTPLPGFLGQPDAIEYTAKNTNGVPAKQPGKISGRYNEIEPKSSTSTGEQGVEQSSDPLTEMFPGLPENAGASYQLDGADDDGKLVRAGEGTFQIKDGKVVFTPEADFVGTAQSVTIQLTTVNGDRLHSSYVPTVTAKQPDPNQPGTEPEPNTPEPSEPSTDPQPNDPDDDSDQGQSDAPGQPKEPSPEPRSSDHRQSSPAASQDATDQPTAKPTKSGSKPGKLPVTGAEGVAGLLAAASAVLIAAGYVTVRRNRD